jgi:addiction module HigA family antidote
VEWQPLAATPGRCATYWTAQVTLPQSRDHDCRLARAIGVSPRRINEIVLGKRAITADTDLRLARYYQISEGLFLGLQADYELRTMRRALGDKLDFIRPRTA